MSAFPKPLTQGDSWSHLAAGNANPAPTWAGSLILRAPGGVAVTLASTAEGANHRFTASAATTAGWVAGRWSWQLRFSNATTGEVVTREAGALTVSRNLATTAEVETHNEKMVRLLKAALEGRATDGIETASYNGKSLTKCSLAELRNALAEYEQRLHAEQMAAGLIKPTSRTVLVRF